MTRQLSAIKLPNEFEKKQTNEIVLTKTSLSVPCTNPFSEALFGVDNVVLVCYVQSRPLAVVKIHHGGHKSLAAARSRPQCLRCFLAVIRKRALESRLGGRRRDKSRRPLDMRSRQIFVISLSVRLRESRTPGAYCVKSRGVELSRYGAQVER